MGLSTTMIPILKDMVIDMIPIAIFFFGVRLIFKMVYSAMSGRIDI